MKYSKLRSWTHRARFVSIVAIAACLLVAAFTGVLIWLLVASSDNVRVTAYLIGVFSVFALPFFVTGILLTVASFDNRDL